MSDWAGAAAWRNGAGTCVRMRAVPGGREGLLWMPRNSGRAAGLIWPCSASRSAAWGGGLYQSASGSKRGVIYTLLFTLLYNNHKFECTRKHASLWSCFV